MAFYPSTRYHKSGINRIVHNPDQEPQGEGWSDKPWPPLVVPVKLAPCCEELAKKFERAYARLLNHRDVLQVERDAALAERNGALMDLEANQRELDAVTTQLAKRALADPTPEEKAEPMAETPEQVDPKGGKSVKFAKKPATPAE
jgi:hypothetical protein